MLTLGQCHHDRLVVGVGAIVGDIVRCQLAEAVIQVISELRACFGTEAEGGQCGVNGGIQDLERFRCSLASLGVFPDTSPLGVEFGK